MKGMGKGRKTNYFWNERKKERWSETIWSYRKESVRRNPLLVLMNSKRIGFRT